MEIIQRIKMNNNNKENTLMHSIVNLNLLLTKNTKTQNKNLKI